MRKTAWTAALCAGASWGSAARAAAAGGGAPRSFPRVVLRRAASFRRVVLRLQLAQETWSATVLLFMHPRKVLLARPVRTHISGIMSHRTAGSSAGTGGPVPQVTAKTDKGLPVPQVNRTGYIGGCQFRRLQNGVHRGAESRDSARSGGPRSGRPSVQGGGRQAREIC